MIVYFNKDGVNTTQIKHGETIKQGNDFDLYLLFAKEVNLRGTGLELKFKKPGEKNFSNQVFYGTFNERIEEKKYNIFRLENYVFTRSVPREMIFDLKDGELYDGYKFIGGSDLTSKDGNLECIITLIDTETQKVLSQAKIRIFVEYNSSYEAEVTVNHDEYNTLLLKITELINKNIGLATNITYDELTQSMVFHFSNGETASFSIPFAYLSELKKKIDDLPIIEGYYSEDDFYLDEEHTNIIEGVVGKLYIDKTNGKCVIYRFDGENYILSSDVEEITDLEIQNILYGKRRV